MWCVCGVVCVVGATGGGDDGAVGTTVAVGVVGGIDNVAAVGGGVGGGSGVVGNVGVHTIIVGGGGVCVCVVGGVGGGVCGVVCGGCWC